MIIKKKYTLPQPIIEDEQIIDDSAIDSVEYTSHKDIVDDEKEPVLEEGISIKQDKKEQKEEPKKKKTIDDLDLSLDNINIEQRVERREGTRRRGYRRTQDRNVVSRAQKEALSIKEIAKKEGYEEGIASAQKDIESLKNSLSEFFNYKDEVYEKVSDTVLDIALEISRKIINKQVETDKEYIIPLIKGVLDEVNKTENKIILKVMPKDVEIVKDKISEIFADNSFEAKISVIPDGEIKEGGVIVETSNGLIDATIATQISIIESVLKKQEES